MKQYHELLRRVLNGGVWQENRTGTRSKLVLGEIMRFDLSEGFPAVTTKKLYFNHVVNELIFFVRGLTNNNWLNDRGTHIWDKWAAPDGELGPVYGRQWRAFNRGPLAQPYEIGAPAPNILSRVESNVTPLGFDQLLWAERELRENRDSRQIIVSAWNPLQISQMALPPCHVLFHLRAVNEELHLTMFQRSCDLFLGVPFNIASYALLTHMLAITTGLKAGSFIWIGNDCHIYENHLDQVEEMLSRETRKLPTLERNIIVNSIVDFETEDFGLRNYDPHPPIKGKVAV